MTYIGCKLRFTFITSSCINFLTVSLPTKIIIMIKKSCISELSFLIGFAVELHKKTILKLGKATDLKQTNKHVL